MHTINGIIITNQERFDSLNTHIDFSGDCICISYFEDDERCYSEHWGEHGARDFDKWGFKVIYNRDVQ